MSSKDTSHAVYVLKYFHEEPASLEILTRESHADARKPDGQALSLEEFLAAPRYYRGYVAATDLETGRIGASTLPETVAGMLHRVLPTPRVHFSVDRQLWTSFQDATTRPDLQAALADRNPRSLIVCGLESFAETRPFVEIILREDRRTALRPITEVLDQGGVVLLPEPSHDGHDWAVFSAEPLADRVTNALSDMELEDAQAYVIPFVKARAEHRFYFERHDPDMFASYRVR